MREMKVIVDCRYIRPEPSGIGSYVRAIASRIPRLAPDDRFEMWTSPREPAPFDPPPNVTFRPVRGAPMGPGTMLWPGRLAPLAGADVFHSPQSVLGRSIRCATVVTVHDVMWVTAPRIVEANPFHRTIRYPFFAGGALFALRNATILLSVSRATASAIEAFDPSLAPRVRVAQNGFEEGWFAPPLDAALARSRASRIIETEAPYFLVLGTNQPYKGHEVALRSFAAAARAEARLVFVQRRGGRGDLPRLARELGVEARVVWREALSREDVLALLQSATALLHPSLVEGFGLPVLEAAACGAPVIASDIPSLREVLGDAGLFAAPTDVDGFRRAIERVLDDPALREDLRARGIERARGFSWDACAAATLSAYREAALAGARR